MCTLSADKPKQTNFRIPLGAWRQCEIDGRIAIHLLIRTHVPATGLWGIRICNQRQKLFTLLLKMPSWCVFNKHARAFPTPKMYSAAFWIFTCRWFPGERMPVPCADNPTENTNFLFVKKNSAALSASLFEWQSFLICNAKKRTYYQQKILSQCPIPSIRSIQFTNLTIYPNSIETTSL